MSNEWQGGLPPVGAKCEYSFNMFDDESMTIPATFIGMDGREAVIKIYNPERKYTTTTINCLRPIKSEADKLRDEQIERVSLSLALMASGWFNQPNSRAEGLDKQISGYLLHKGCRMTRELTDDVISGLLDKHEEEHSRTLCTREFAKMVAAYVRGELEL